MTRLRKKLAAVILLGVAAAGASGCQRHAGPPAEQTTAGGIDLAAMDRTVRPGDDFYTYANGNWMRATEIPADRSGIGGFAIADRRTERRLAALVDDIARSSPAPGTDAALIKRFHSAFLNRRAIDAAGMRVARADLERIGAIADRAALSRELGRQLRADVDPLNATDFATENLFRPVFHPRAGR